MTSVPVDPSDPARSAAIASLMHAAYRLSAADARLRGRATRTPGALSLAHARALRTLAEHGPMTVRGLADHVETTPAAVTQLVTGLVSDGLVVRERSVDGDRRTSIVVLTDEGRRRHAEREALLIGLLRGVVRDLDAGTVESVGAVLDRLAAVYDEL